MLWEAEASEKVTLCMVRIFKGFLLTQSMFSDAALEIIRVFKSVLHVHGAAALSNYYWSSKITHGNTNNLNGSLAKC